MAKKTAAEKREEEAVAEMDRMFGVDVVPLGETSLRVRRVTSRQQQRIASDVVGTVHQISIDLQKLLKDPVPDENGHTPERLTEDELTAEAAALEETMHVDLVRGIEVYVVNAKELNLEGWATASLSQLFTTMQQRSSSAVSKAVGLHFPTNGQSA